MVPGSSPGSAPILLWICVFIGIRFKVNAPGESPGALFDYNVESNITSILQPHQEIVSAVFLSTPFVQNLEKKHIQK